MSLDDPTLYSVRAILLISMTQYRPPRIEKDLVSQLNALCPFLGQPDLKVTELLYFWSGASWKRGWRRMLIGEVFKSLPEGEFNPQHIMNAAEKSGMIPGQCSQQKSEWRNLMLAEVQEVLPSTGRKRADWILAYNTGLKAISKGEFYEFP